MKRIRFLLLACMVSLSTQSFAQEKKKSATPPKEIPASMLDPGIHAPPPKELVAPPQGDVFVHVEQPPQFPGGTQAMFAFIQKHKKYPQEGADADKEGKVYVSFIVKSDGSIEHVEVKRSLTPSHDAEAVRVIKMMPKWIPAQQNGKAVNCWYTLPIAFYFL